uniref:Uncharacterized protein n=1 Tax=Mucochytrium quahogii TaxID=96639 RepID=A0A7S2WJL9_9STRA|mmetsp:Transcript_4861/g.7354  ORF Transcript_4861/g.7354 Transcript_4861/m.7354 type:complete len:219 (-) Transcript_4861:239-895(-)
MMLRGCRWLSSQARPPPPPPPPRRGVDKVKRSSKLDAGGGSAAVRRGKGSSVGGLVGVLGLVGVMIGVSKYLSYRESNQGVSNIYYNRRHEEEEEKVEELPPIKYEDSARAFIEELAKKGDNQASQVFQATEVDTTGGDSFDEKEFEATFRLDVTREGLLRTLKMMLNGKRKQEQMEIKRINALPLSRRPFGYEEQLRYLRQEKQELKDQIKALEKRK